MDGKKKELDTGIQFFQIESFAVNFIFIDTGEECKSGLFEVDLSGGVYEAHGEYLTFESFCLPDWALSSVEVILNGQGLYDKNRPCPKLLQTLPDMPEEAVPVSQPFRHRPPNKYSGPIGKATCTAII